MTQIKDTKGWFEKAIPNPTTANFRVQLGVHLEECSEMFEALDVQLLDNPFEGDRWLRLQNDLKDMATALKSGKATVMGMNPAELLDALCDQQVTGTGVAHMLGMDIKLGMAKVDASNWSKFDADGNPIFDANGKISKGPDYHKPDLAACLPSSERLKAVLG